MVLTRFGPKTEQNHDRSNVELVVTTHGVPHGMQTGHPMTTRFTPPLIQTPALSLHEARIALPEDPARWLSMGRFTRPLPLQVSLLHTDSMSIAASSAATLRFSVYSAANGTKGICLSTKPGATQLKVLLRGNTLPTLTWLNSCFESEQMVVLARDIETGKDLVISAPVPVPDISGLLGLLREPSRLTDDQQAQGMAWLVRRLSSPPDQERPAGSRVRKVLMCVEDAHALIPLMPDLGMSSGIRASPLQ